MCGIGNQEIVCAIGGNAPPSRIGIVAADLVAAIADQSMPLAVAAGAVVDGFGAIKRKKTMHRHRRARIGIARAVPRREARCQGPSSMPPATPKVTLTQVARSPSATPMTSETIVFRKKGIIQVGISSDVRHQLHTAGQLHVMGSHKSRARRFVKMPILRQMGLTTSAADAITRA